MSDDKSVGECYGFNQETRNRVDKLEERHDKLAERVFEKLEKLEENLISRLPIWATLFIALLTALVSGLLVKAVLK